MTFPILGGNGAVAVGEASSLRFNDDDSPLLSKTFSTNPTDQKLTTISFWFKVGNVTSAFRALYRLNDGSNTGTVYLRSGNDLQFGYDVSSGSLDVRPDGVIRDVSAWYHFFVKVDTTQSTASNRVKIYINGIERSYSTSTYPNQNATLDHLTNGKTYYIGGDGQSNDKYFDGYIAEFHVIDGQAKNPTDFGEFDSTSGIWKPKDYEGSYGTNGFKLNFSDSDSLGADSSGNGNNFTATNLASTDQTTDTPANNFATLNPLYQQGSNTFSEGNCKVVLEAGDGTKGAAGNFAPPSGKWYWEVKHVSSSNSSIMVREVSDKEDDISYFHGNYAGYEKNDGDQNITGNTTSDYGASYANGDIIMVAMDMDNDRVYFGKNGLWNDGDGNADESNLSDFVPLNGVDNGVPAVANANASATATFEFNFGNPPFSITSGNSDDNGYGNFEYAPPSGYLALCTQNLATELSPTIDDGSQYFNTTLVTSTGSDITINTGFKPDFLWTKSRSYDARHELHNTTSGNNKRLVSNLSGAEETFSNYMEFTSNGATFKTNLPHALAGGGAGRTGVAWSWRANGGTTSSNTDGSTTSTVQANTTAGFSIVTHTGTGSGSTTVGHGLGKVPTMIIVKDRSQARSWNVYHQSIGNNSGVNLNNSNAQSGADSGWWNNTTPTSSVFTLGTYANESSNYVSYCFADIEGYSKFGSYTSNGNIDGPFVYTGFKPSFIIMKASNQTAEWVLQDTARDTVNPVNNRLIPNDNIVEYTNTSCLTDFVSNGFKMRSNHPSNNFSGYDFIYMAFAENPFVSSSGVPNTAI